MNERFKNGGRGTTRREILSLGAIAGGTLATGGTAWGENSSATNVSEEQEPKPQRHRKKLIAWGWDTNYPEKIEVNIRKMEEMPWDGIVMGYFKANHGGEKLMFEWQCFGEKKFERSDLAETIETLKRIKFEKFTDNFLRFNVQPGDVDWFDDFSSILHNARLWAEVARETGMKGWKFDVEDYQEKLFTYKKQKYAETKTFEEYLAQIQLRGKQVMEAIQEGYPDITLLLSFGQSYIARNPHASERLKELPDYGMLPPFINGLVEGAGPEVRLIDGQEHAYGYLTAEDYYRGYHGVRQESLSLVPDELQEKYRRQMDVGVAMWANFQMALPITTAKHWPAHYLAEADRLKVFEQNIYYGLKTTDEYFWLYSEQMGWWEEGYPTATPAGALEAIRRSREKIEKDELLGFDLSAEVADARRKMAEATKTS